MTIEMKDITIIIPTRTDLDTIRGAVEQIRKFKEYDDCKIFIGADAPSEEIETWIIDNSRTYRYDSRIFKADTIHERWGIVHMVESLVKDVTTDYIYYMHDDNRIGRYTIQKLIDAYEEKTILSSLRVEPPLYPQSPEKYLEDLGIDQASFNELGFLAIEESLIQKEKGNKVEGFFAPHFFKKADWVGYDHTFAPQSREDSDIAQRFIDAGFKLITVRDSVVYHFSGKGSRKKTGLNTNNGKDSNEWQKTNYKNERNYIRKWGTLEHTEYILPLRVPKIPVSMHVLSCDRDKEYVFNFLDRYEPFFDEIVFVIDSDGNSEVEKEVQRYTEKEQQFKPTNFSQDKIKVLYRKLNNDFAGQTNFAIENCTYNWTIKIDLDEEMPPEFLLGYKRVIKQIMDENPNITVIGFPRINLLDGKVSNDIPREHWFTKEFDKYNNTNEVKNPDLQFRLHHKDEKWIGNVHEVPESVYKNDKDRITVIQNLHLYHPKDRQRQFKQEQQYSSIIKPIVTKQPPKKILGDSVVYTIEGITHHFREEMKEFKKRGYDIFFLDTNYNSKFGEEWKDFYTPIDVYSDNYVTLINQPPERWGRSQHYKNPIGYLAFEGKLPQGWVEIINKSPILELWTPSKYCAQQFVESGVTKPIWVVPHAVDPNVWKPKKVTDEDLLKLKEDKFMFLSIGADNVGRKGFELVVQAFTEEFKKDENVKLVFKVNKIYEKDGNFQQKIKNYINNNGNINIEYIDEDLTEESLVDLVNTADVYISAHKSEGFGLNILQAMAAGVPVITTGASGNMDFCTKESCLLIDVEKEVYAPFVPPYERTRWFKPSLESLKKNMRLAYKSHKQFKKVALEQSKEIRKVWTWEHVVDIMEQRIKELTT